MLRRYSRIASFLLIFLLISFITTISRIYQTPSLLDTYEQLASSSSVISSSPCQVPSLNPWDPSILSFIKTPPPLECSQTQYELTNRWDNGTLYVDSTQMARLSTNVACFYRCFAKTEGDDITINYTQWTEFRDPVALLCEFVEVYCSRASLPHSTVYTNNHHYVHRRIEAEIRTDEARFKPSVLLFVLDSVSQSSWKRSLPKTYKVLMEKYGSFVFEGMTKVGDHSFPNAVAFLTGKDAATEFGDVTGFFDDHPLVWTDYAEANYTTYYAEDYPAFNLFYYLAKGFARQPVHHYFRPYWLNVYWSFLHRKSTNLCYGNNKMHNLQLSYLSKFLSTYQDSPTFSLNWLTELGHDYSNQVTVGDEDIANFFRRHREKLKDSFVFVMSDHGHRFDSIRETAVGRLEERMPFFSMHLPERLMKKQPGLREVVKENTKVLTTFWDVYVTLRDILHMSRTQQWKSLGVVNSSGDLQKHAKRFREYANKGTSLLRPIKPRSCREARIPDEFCVCNREVAVEVEDEKVRHASQAVISHLNELLAGSSQCARLALSQIRHAQVVLPAKGIASRRSDMDYRVAIEANPSKAVVEAMVRYDTRRDTFAVVGDVNRINRYGNQSLCVDTQKLRKYCYCQL